MQNKWKIGLMLAIAGLVVPMSVRADEIVVEETVVTEDGGADALAEKNSADAVAAYNPDGSLFKQITELEQEKVLMQLEKERAQLNLELDRLAAEKIKLHMEIDTLSGRAEQQQQELEQAKAEIEMQTARLEREKEALEKAALNPAPVATSLGVSGAPAPAAKISDEYRLVNVVGAGGQLHATVQDLASGQNKKLSVGKTLDGYTVKSISLDDGVVFTDADGQSQTLNISSNQ